MCNASIGWVLILQKRFRYFLQKNIKKSKDFAKLKLAQFHNFVLIENDIYYTSYPFL